jgi:hypothetical protein
MQESRESRIAALLARGLFRVRRCFGRTSVPNRQQIDQEHTPLAAAKKGGDK